MRIGEAIGRAVGGLLAPFAAEGSLIRKARFFHPDGVVYRAEVKPLASHGELGLLAERLEGHALVRLSSGWWKQHDGVEPPDALGVAVRLRKSASLSPEVDPGDQDLLFESFRRLVALPVAPLVTDESDFLANDYYAILPFSVRGLGRAKLRLVPEPVKAPGADRLERLAHAAAAGRAVLRLEIDRPSGDSPWTPIAAIELKAPVKINQDRLGFSPFHSGAGIMPTGVLHAVRAAVYAASQRGRKAAKGID